MRVAGREPVAPFDAYWKCFHSEIPVTVEQIEQGHSSVFGAQGIDLVAPDTPPPVDGPSRR